MSIRRIWQQWMQLPQLLWIMAMGFVFVLVATVILPKAPVEIDVSHSYGRTHSLRATPSEFGLVMPRPAYPAADIPISERGNLEHMDLPVPAPQLPSSETVEPPSWTVPYGREFWRQPAAPVDQDPERSGAAEVPAALNLGDIIERVGLAFRQDGSPYPRSRAKTYTASLESGQLSFSPHGPQSPESAADAAAGGESWLNPQTGALEPDLTSAGSERRRPDLEEIPGRSSGIRPDPTVRLVLSTSGVRQNDSALYSLETPAPAPVVAGNTAQRLLNSQIGLVEHFEMREDGAHLTWVLGQKPAGGEPLTIEFQASGLSYAGATEHGHHFADAQGNARVRVGNVTAVDASGRAWPLTVTAVNAEAQVCLLGMEISPELLAQATYPLAIDPIISPEFGMDNPVFPSVARHRQPALAANGDSWLVVWADTTDYPVADIFGVRVSSAGRLLDAYPISICTASGIQLDPAVAGNGIDWLVVWSDSRSGTSSDIYGTRITDAGIVQSPDGVIISTVANNQISPVVAANGTNWLVVWRDDRSFATSAFDIYGTRVNASGAVQSQSGVAISTTAGSQESPALAANGTDWLVVWQDGRGGPLERDIYGTRVNASGTVLNSGGIAISTAANEQFGPAVAANGTNWLVVWKDQRLSSFGDIYGTRVSGNGSLLDGASGFGISTAIAGTGDPAVAANGSYWLVVWENSPNGTNASTIYGNRVSLTGEVWDGIGFEIGSFGSTQRFPVVAWNETYSLVVWADYNFALGDYSHIHGAQVENGFVLPGEGIRISNGIANFQESPAVAGNGTDWLVVWQDHRNGFDSFNPDIFGVRVNRNGMVLDPSGIALSTNSSFQYPPAVAANGVNWLVVWQDYRNSDWDIYGKLVSGGSGPALVGNDIPVSLETGSQFSPAVAANGTNWLVVWDDTRSGSAADIYGTRVSQGGVVLDASGIPISTEINSQHSAAVAANGSEWLVVWTDDRNDAISSSDIYGTRVGGSGNVLNPSGIPISRTLRQQQSVAVAASGKEWLVVWADSRAQISFDIYGARVGQDGLVLDADGIPICTTTDFQYGPAVDALGNDWLVVWYDYRGQNGDIYGTRVSRNGAITPGDGFPISIAENDQLGPSIAANGPVSMVVWQSYESGNSFRTRAKFLADPYSQAVMLGDQVEYGVLPGSQPYQWRRDGVPIPNATNASYIVNSARAMDAGLYDVVEGSTTNGPWALTVFSPMPDQMANATSNVKYSPVFSGPTNGLIWSWRAWLVGGELVADEDSSTLVLTNVAYDAQVLATVAYPGGNSLELAANLKVNYFVGQEIPPPAGANLALTQTGPIASPPGSEPICWAQLLPPIYGRAHALAPGPFTLVWTNAATNAVFTSATILDQPTMPVTLGQEVPPPPGFDTSSLPDTGPVFPAGAALWHNPSGRLYATRSGSFGVTWAAAGGAIACPRVPIQYECSWPETAATYQIHVANSSANPLSNWGAVSQASLLDSDPGTGVQVTQGVGSLPVFSATGIGRSLLLLSPGDWAVTNIYFQFVKTVAWDDPAYLAETNATIGQAIVPPASHAPTAGAPWVQTARPRIATPSGAGDPNGTKGFSLWSPANRLGLIVPVNRDGLATEDDDLVVIYFQKGSKLIDPAQNGALLNSDIGWPALPVRYAANWPTAPEAEIVIASQAGSGPVPLGIGWTIYRQPDPNLRGFNPNEEHAMELAARPAVETSALRIDVEGLTLLSSRAASMEVRVSPGTNIFNSGTLNVAGLQEGRLRAYWQATGTDMLPELSLTNTGFAGPHTLVFALNSSTNETIPEWSDLTNQFQLRLSGDLTGEQRVSVQEIPTNSLGLVVNPRHFSMVEWSDRSFQISLSRPPTGTVEVLVTPPIGSGLTLLNPGPVTFDASNWDAPKAVTLRAAKDNDHFPNTNTLQVTASGSFDQTLSMTVVVVDLDVPPLSIFALRDDLGDLPGTPSPVRSEPYVLAVGTNGVGATRFLVYRVKAEHIDAQEPANSILFHYAGKAGKQIQPPYPLNTLPNWHKESRHASGPGWLDRKQVTWARAAGDDGGTAEIVMRFFYPVQSSFDFPKLAAPPNVNTLIPWLDQRPGGNVGVPTDVAFAISWPDNLPELRVAETLVKPKFGLPAIAGQTSVDIIYEQSVATAGLKSVELIDPTGEWSVDLAALPGDLAGKTVTNTANRTLFAKLPPHLRHRLWWTSGKLYFKGEWRDSFGSVEPRGYALLNVITERDRTNYLLNSELLSEDDDFIDAINQLTALARQARVVGPNDVFDSLALTAGLGQGTGYVTLAFNDAVRPPELAENRGTPVSLEIIRVTCPLYRGEIKVIESEDPFDERVTLRHTGDFAGKADGFAFQWKYWESNGGIPPVRDDDGNGEPDNWEDYPSSPADGQGALDNTVEGSGTFVLKDHWYICRYRPTSPLTPCGTNWSQWTPPALSEGWIDRVLAKVNPFTDVDYGNQGNDTIVSMISQAGVRSLGPVPLNVQSLRDYGFIEIYETVLKRGRELSIDGNVSDAGANKALMSVTRNLADLYSLLGNEAYADAADPTIAFGTDDGQHGNAATTIHSFMDQTASLLEEELALLRGISPGASSQEPGGRVLINVKNHPAYNRLRWNFTRNITGGEVAYAMNYNIRAQATQTNISAATAQQQYPQGHGDAWGHYLTALKGYYRLIRNPNFDWNPEVEFVTLGGIGEPIAVNYMDERKFARAAAARARTGAEVVSLSYRAHFSEDPALQWQGYPDSATNRAWGVSEWGSRAGQGALFDWALANALLPAESGAPAESIEKVDRTTVTELREVSAAFLTIQEQVDKADGGLNPLGLAKNTVPFDIDPVQISQGKTHFEQIYERAVTALNNAIAVFNHANNYSQNLRRQADSELDFTQTVLEREADFNNRLIEVFGYPYAQDIGLTGSYPSGYNGPDLYHYMYVDPSAISGETVPSVTEFSVTISEPSVTANGALVYTTKPVTFHLANNGLGLVKPAHWNQPRRAPGEIQRAHSDLLQAKARFERALGEYENLLASIDDQAELLLAQHDLNSEEINILVTGQNRQESLNTAIRRSRDRQITFRMVADKAKIIANATAEAFPKTTGFIAGLANGVIGDFTSGPRSAVLLAATVTSEVMNQNANRESLAELDHQQAKELAQSQANIQLTTMRQELGELQQLRQLEQTIRQEALLRLDLYTMQEAMQQTAGNYTATLARGQRILEDRLRFRQQTAAQIQQYRYRDMAFRIFRHDALQKYRAQFDLAARYVYLAAKTYDYETNLRSDDSRRPGELFFGDIVRARTIGRINNGVPEAGTQGDPGLASPIAQMRGNFSEVKSQLGFNNPSEETGRFSLRTELFRTQTNQNASAVWRETLRQHVVPNLLDLEEYRRFCTPIPNAQTIEPAIVIPFSTTITFGQNLFGWPLGGGDNNFDSTAFTTKVRSVGIWFGNYSTLGGGLANTPRVYLVPVGSDVMRTPRRFNGDLSVTREWNIVDQLLPAPFALSGGELINNLGWVPINETLSGGFADIRQHNFMLAYHDGGFNSSQTTSSSRLIGRSVWNTSWLLIIPAGSLLADRNEAINRFIDGPSVNGQRTGNGITDIKIYFQTYAYPGN